MAVVCVCGGGGGGMSYSITTGTYININRTVNMSGVMFTDNTTMLNTVE